jgi:hypothetical protein
LCAFDPGGGHEFKLKGAPFSVIGAERRRNRPRETPDAGRLFSVLDQDVRGPADAVSGPWGHRRLDSAPKQKQDQGDHDGRLDRPIVFGLDLGDRVVDGLARSGRSMAIDDGGESGDFGLDDGDVGGGRHYSVSARMAYAACSLSGIPDNPAAR